MKYYEIKRNIPTDIKIILFFIIISLLLAIFLPIKSKTIEVKETYKDIIPKTTQIPIISSKFVEKNTSFKNNRNISINYTLEKVGELDSNSRYDRNYAEQEYHLIFNENIDYCVKYDFTFYEGNRIVDKNKNEICFENSTSKYFSVEELYLGNINNYHFEINFTDLPTKEIVNYSNIVEKKLVNVTTYQNITTYINVTKERIINKTIKTWFFG